MQVQGSAAQVGCYCPVRVDSLELMATLNRSMEEENLFTSGRSLKQLSLVGPPRCPPYLNVHLRLVTIEIRDPS